MSQNTSFKKTRKGAITINGTRPSIQNGQLLCSSGVPSLDAVIGGGIPVGSVFMLCEDSSHQYSHLLTRYFLAEGIVNGHETFLTTADNTGDSYINHLPEPILLEEDLKSTSSSEMKIAWRYQNAPEIQTAVSLHSKYGNYYDISKTMNETLLKNSKTTLLDLNNSPHDSGRKDIFKKFLNELDKYINENNLSIPAAVKSQKQLNILRIAIPSFCSPFWGCFYGEEQKICHIIRFLNCLRTIARNSLVVCWITVPSYLHSSSDFQLMKHNVDMVVHLESFGGKLNPLYKEYHGLLKLQKLPVLNTLLPFTPDSQDFAFKLRRKKFTVERLHLPPDIGETVKRQGVEEEETSVRTMCGSSNAKSSIDF